MNEGLEKLRSIGAQKIHEQTHIARRYVQALLHESFEGMQRVQLLGFISILEREYGVDLTSLRMSATEYFKIAEETMVKEEPSYKKELLVSSKNNHKKLYILFALVAVLFVVVLLYFALQSESPAAKEENATLTMPQSSPQQSDAKHLNNENNATLLPLEEKHVSIQKEEQNKEEQKQEHILKPEKSLTHTFTIIPKKKVWVGIIDLDSDKKRQKVITEPLELNASKEYLLIFGHGYIDMEVDGNKTNFKSPKSMKFLYRKGSLREIDNAEFKEYNKGKLW